MVCMFSEYSEINILLNDLTDSNGATCIHESSPYYDERVTEEQSCRMFLDSNKYFFKKDRKEKLENLKNNL